MGSNLLEREETCPHQSCLWIQFVKAGKLLGSVEQSMILNKARISSHMFFKCASKTKSKYK